VPFLLNFNILIRIRTTIFLSLLFALLMSSTCRKNCVERNYSFSINVTARPNLDSININDTIWLELDALTSLTDNNSGNTIDFSNAGNLSTVIQAGRFVGGNILNPGVVDADNEFEFTVIKGTALQNNSGVITEIKPIENNGRYLVKCGIIPKAKAIYGIAISNAANVSRITEKCDKAGFSITFANTNQHLYFYEQNRPGYTPSEYERTHMYCFKVK
jgi:hypothetical protein